MGKASICRGLSLVHKQSDLFHMCQQDWVQGRKDTRGRGWRQDSEVKNALLFILATLPKDPSSIPSTQDGQFPSTCSKKSDTLFWSLRVLHTCYTHSDTNTHKHKNKNINLKKKDTL